MSENNEGIKTVSWADKKTKKKKEIDLRMKIPEEEVIAQKLKDKEEAKERMAKKLRDKEANKEAIALKLAEKERKKEESRLRRIENKKYGIQTGDQSVTSQSTLSRVEFSNSVTPTSEDYAEISNEIQIPLNTNMAKYQYLYEEYHTIECVPYDICHRERKQDVNLLYILGRPYLQHDNERELHEPQFHNSHVRFGDYLTTNKLLVTCMIWHKGAPRVQCVLDIIRPIRIKIPIHWSFKFREYIAKHKENRCVLVDSVPEYDEFEFKDIDDYTRAYNRMHGLVHDEYGHSKCHTPEHNMITFMNDALVTPSRVGHRTMSGIIRRCRLIIRHKDVMSITRLKTGIIIYKVNFDKVLLVPIDFPIGCEIEPYPIFSFQYTPPVDYNESEFDTKLYYPKISYHKLGMKVMSFDFDGTRDINSRVKIGDMVAIMYYNGITYIYSTVNVESIMSATSEPKPVESKESAESVESVESAELTEPKHNTIQYKQFHSIDEIFDEIRRKHIEFYIRNPLIYISEPRSISNPPEGYHNYDTDLDRELDHNGLNEILYFPFNEFFTHYNITKDRRSSQMVIEFMKLLPHSFPGHIEMDLEKYHTLDEQDFKNIDKIKLRIEKCKAMHDYLTENIETYGRPPTKAGWLGN